MIGRGTRLCPDLFSSDQVKQTFRIFDFCFNFAFFDENPEGIEGSSGEALGVKLFRHRVQLVAAIQSNQEIEPSGPLSRQVIDILHAEVQGMNEDNFLVRPHRRCQRLLSHMLTQTEAPTLAWFVRSLVGMDREAAKKAFGRFLSDRSITPQQIRFIELIVDQLTARGVIEPSALYESPFTDIDAGGPEAVFVGKDDVIDGLFETLEGVAESLRKVE